ncbi:YceI family protein [Arcicella sp. LKC2W]|uniref:YceI family protein n=1 Tax=Arcicella sp. LKC2W TaxID=2984198 RepID=UPI002B20627B|nr:YceI family protein [Arcicella sp. LKC2W]MEA5459241.1 YceI family protein [Arcicella sp. LKC2W]
MKTILIFANILLSISLQAQKTFNVNILETKISWTGYASVGNYAPTGTLSLSKGTVVLKDNKILKAVIEFDMKTITHENKDLQIHLKNEDFFDVEKYPKAVFTLEKVVKNQAVGILKIKNIQKRITFPIIIEQAKDKIHIKSTINIDRTQFGIKYNSTNFFQNLGDYAIKDNFELKTDLLVEN